MHLPQTFCLQMRVLSFFFLCNQALAWRYSYCLHAQERDSEVASFEGTEEGGVRLQHLAHCVQDCLAPILHADTKLMRGKKRGRPLLHSPGNSLGGQPAQDVSHRYRPYAPIFLGSSVETCATQERGHLNWHSSSSHSVHQGGEGLKGPVSPSRGCLECC